SGDASGNTVWVDGQRPQQFNVLMNTVSSGYFAALGIPLVAGRDFDARDAQGSAPVAIVNEAFAARQPAGHSVLGARVTREATPREPEKTFEIVGVVKNSIYMDLKEDLS